MSRYLFQEEMPRLHQNSIHRREIAFFRLLFLFTLFLVVAIMRYLRSQPFCSREGWPKYISTAPVSAYCKRVGVAKALDQCSLLFSSRSVTVVDVRDQRIPN